MHGKKSKLKRLHWDSETLIKITQLYALRGCLVKREPSKCHNRRKAERQEVVPAYVFFRLFIVGLRDRSGGC